MKEDFLHYLWRYSKIPLQALKTTEGKSLVIKRPGTLNTNAGPDFIQALIEIEDTVWAGHVEMHLRSSAWYEHLHHQDPNYSNVILHVVWEHDKEVVVSGRSILPVLELKELIPPIYLKNYLRLTGVTTRMMNCAEQHHAVPYSLWERWYEELLYQRLEQRFARMLRMDPDQRTHWEELLFRGIFRYMGARVNADSFYSIASNIGVEKVRKIVSAGEDLETVFHGMAGLLAARGENAFYRQRKREYEFLKRKYALEDHGVIRPVFFRLRPMSFPTLRLSQLSELFQARQGLFARVLQANSLDELKALFEVAAGPYWNTRYTYTGSLSSNCSKRLSDSRKDILLLNAVFPVLYAYYKNRGSDKFRQLSLMAAGISPEQNHVLKAMKREGVPLRHAGHTQALLELHGSYCSLNRCLHCKIGSFIIGG